MIGYANVEFFFHPLLCITYGLRVTPNTFHNDNIQMGQMVRCLWGHFDGSVWDKSTGVFVRVSQRKFSMCPKKNILSKCQKTSRQCFQKNCYQWVPKTLVHVSQRFHLSIWLLKTEKNACKGDNVIVEQQL